MSTKRPLNQAPDGWALTLTPGAKVTRELNKICVPITLTRHGAPVESTVVRLTESAAGTLRDEIDYLLGYKTREREMYRTHAYEAEREQEREARTGGAA
ncbi:hypothetical protein ACWEV4_02335 [Streptomyces sp. NPDC003860]